MTTLAHRSALRGPRSGGFAARRASDPLGLAPVPPRVAAAAPGGDAPHRRGRGRGRQHHDRLQLGRRRRRRVRLGQPPAQVRRLRSAQARGRTRRRPAMVRDDRSHRPSLDPGPGRRRERRLPRADPHGALRRRAPRAPPRQLPGRPRPGRRHRRGRRPPAARARDDLGARRTPADRRRHRREPARPERRVRARLPLVRGRAGPSRLFWSTRAPRRSSPSSGGPHPASALVGSEERGSDQRRRDAGDVLRGHRLPAPGLARRRGGLRSRRAATAPPARHARRHRRHPEAPSARPGDQRRPRRHDRGSRRDDRGPRALGRRRPDARVRGRPSRRPAQPSVGS